MILASKQAGDYLIHHVSDQPWPGCTVTVFGMQFTWMSSAIASMIVVAIVLCWYLPRKARRVTATGKGGVLEVLVQFVRNNIAIPALGEHAHKFLPYLLTLFVFVLGMNFIGLLPFGPICQMIPFNKDSHGHAMFTVGATPTGVLCICGAMAGSTLGIIFVMGMYRAAQKKHEHFDWPMWKCLLAAPWLWFISLSPHVPGMIGKVLAVPLAILEFVGAIAKCFALMIRIFANMMAGHFLLAVMMMFIVQTLQATVTSVMNPAMENDIHFFYIAPVCVVASVLVNLMEIMVAGLQAYIFTFLSAMFFGLYVEVSH